ncbi:MAG: hypothetical protein SFX73_07465 [Kofleriaceae bacterium]|nr:hypothetical protein [Kofleriaceae bacterium]
MRLLVVLTLLSGLAGSAFADISLGAVTLRNGSNSSIGSVDRDGTIRNSSNSSIGKVESDGTIRNGSNSSIGRIESDGTIRNSSNSSVGKVEGYNTSLRHMVAAVLFFGGSVSVLSL